MKLSFHGAAQTVTGSKHLLTLGSGKRILLDCGMFQGRRKDNDALNRHWGFTPRDIDYLILSHAHIDHCGLIPRLVKDGFNGTIFCTPATYDLCEVMLPDSGFIQEGDAAYESKRRAKKGKPPVQPLYTSEDAYACLSKFVQVPFNETYRLDPDVTFTLTGNGHLLGSAAVNLEIKESGRTVRICYTGDIGRSIPHMLKKPDTFPQADYIICESTYGDRLHDDEDYTPEDIVKIVRETCVEKKGKLIIPAFSIGRTQEIIYALDYLTTNAQLPPIKVYVDSPLSTKGTNIHRKHLELFNAAMQEYILKDPDPFAFPNLHFIASADESKALNAIKDPCIIISASGMMEAGRIRHHIANNIENPDNTLLVVGYCEPSTLGGKIIAGNKSIRIFGIDYKVNARVEYIRSYSGHGDYKEMIGYLGSQDASKVRKVFLVHGDLPVQNEFKSKLVRAGFQHVEIPAAGTVADL